MTRSNWSEKLFFLFYPPGFSAGSHTRDERRDKRETQEWVRSEPVSREGVAVEGWSQLEPADKKIMRIDGSRWQRPSADVHTRGRPAQPIRWQLLTTLTLNCFFPSLELYFFIYFFIFLVWAPLLHVADDENKEWHKKCVTLTEENEQLKIPTCWLCHILLTESVCHY